MSEGTQGTKPDLAEVVKQLQETVATLQNRHDEATKKITELSQSKSTLESRLTEVDKLKERKAQDAVMLEDLKEKARSISQKMAIDPESGGRELASLLEETRVRTAQSVANDLLPRVQNFVKQNEFVNKRRGENPELAPYEELVTSRVIVLQNSGMGFEEATDKAIKEYKDIIKAGKAGASPSAPSTPAPNNNQAGTPPAGAIGNGGGNPPPSSSAPAEDVSFAKINSDFIKDREERARRQAQGAK